MEQAPAAAPDGTNYCFGGPHPVDTRVVAGPAWDESQGRHLHQYPPFDLRLFVLREGCYHFVGDPTDFGYRGQTYSYYGAHPVLETYGGGWCFMIGGHAHWWRPWSPYFTVAGPWYYWYGPYDPFFWNHWPYYAHYYRAYYPRYYGGGRFYRGRRHDRVVAPPVGRVRAAPARGMAAGAGGGFSTPTDGRRSSHARARLLEPAVRLVGAGAGHGRRRRALAGLVEPAQQHADGGAARDLLAGGPGRVLGGRRIGPSGRRSRRSRRRGSRATLRGGRGPGRRRRLRRRRGSAARPMTPTYRSAPSMPAPSFRSAPAPRPPSYRSAPSGGFRAPAAPAAARRSVGRAPRRAAFRARAGQRAQCAERLPRAPSDSGDGPGRGQLQPWGKMQLSS